MKSICWFITNMTEPSGPGGGRPINCESWCSCPGLGMFLFLEFSWKMNLNNLLKQAFFFFFLQSRYLSWNVQCNLHNRIIIHLCNSWRFKTFEKHALSRGSININILLPHCLLHRNNPPWFHIMHSGGTSENWWAACFSECLCSYERGAVSWSLRQLLTQNNHSWCESSPNELNLMWRQTGSFG